MENQIKSVQDVVDIIKRRRWQLIVPAGIIFLVAAITAFSLPRKYRSTATILIEAQEVPSEYVKTNITSFADQRLQTINQRIMGAPRLIEMVKRFNLYSELRTRVTMEEIVAKMTKDIKFATISADVVDPRSGRPAQATIAFSISFIGASPEVAQQVANELSSLYMEENLKEREKQSVGTSRFLQEEMQAIQDSLAAIEGKVASFKQRNINSLPELSQVNLQAFDGADRDIRQLNDQLRTLKEREGYLQTQLASVQPELSTGDRDALGQLRLRLADLKSRFSDQYPDVVKTRAEIGALEQQMKAANLDPTGNKPDNPAYITLDSQLAGTRSEIGSVRRQVADVVKRRDSYQSRIMASPRVEEGYKTMLVERNNLQQKYDDLSSKAMESKMAHGMEKEQLGERFTLVDPARLPERPFSPNVPAVLLIGLILGLGTGVGVAALKEASDQSVRSADDLARFTGLPVLVTVQPLVTGRERLATGQRRKRYLAAALLGAVACVFIVHFFVMDLDVLWARVSRKLAS